MENSFREENKSIFNLQIDETSRANMLETAKWTKFLGIVNIIFLALYLLVMMSAGAAFSSMSSAYGGSSAGMANFGAAGMIIMALIMVAFTIYPVMCLLRYSKATKSAFLTSNQEEFNAATGYMKGFFKYIGIVMIIVLGLWAISMLFVGLGAAMM